MSATGDTSPSTSAGRPGAASQQPPATAPALELDGITKAFGGVVANSDVSLTVGRGEIVGLLGENGAGKTTLMKIVYGLYQPDAGTIRVDGQEVSIHTPAQAVELGIGMVHQHFTLVPDMTVAENVALAPSGLPRLSRLDDVGREVSKLFAEFGLEVSPDQEVSELAVGAQQRVEIVKALYRGARILILDEPTATLTPQEWEHLARFLRKLAAEGSSVVLITHKLDELMGVVDRCVVLRDGAVVGETAMAGVDKQTLARMMVGRDVSLRAERPRTTPGEPVLRVKGLTVADGDHVRLDDVSLEVRRHEIFGIAGVSGNGQDILVEALLGLRERASGEIHVAGTALEGHGALEFHDCGGAVVLEDRHHSAIALQLPLWENIVLKEIQAAPLSRRGVIDRSAARAKAADLVRRFRVKTPGLDAPIRHLSGGNQQRAVFARELSRDPQLLIASQPTRGLDVGAMEFVYERLNEMKVAGAGILLISSELDEILSIADRIGVMFAGRIVRVLEPEEATPELLGLLMAGDRG